MTRYIGSRLLRLVLVFVIVTFGTMHLIELTPGDPAVAIAGETATPEALDAVRERYGLEEPVYERWWDWTTGVLRGDFGDSQLSRQPVLDLIKERLPITIQLTLMAIVMSLFLVVPLALLAAYHEGSWFDRAINTLSSTLIAIPGFVIALVLVLTFAVWLQWLPVSAWVPLTEDPIENLKHALLPALTLGLAETAILLPVLRADAVGTLEQDYITLARAKGISSGRLLLRHALRPSSISLVTLLGLSLARLFAGAVIVETVFGLPGVGGLLVNSVRTHDLVVVQGVVVFIALVYLAANIIVDVLYSRLDPRVSVS